MASSKSGDSPSKTAIATTGGGIVCSDEEG